MNEKTLNEVNKIVRKYSNILLVYIFGSYVKYKNNKPHDVDIGIFLKDNVDAQKRLNIQLDLTEKLESYFKMRVDVVILNAKSCFFKHQVVKYGQLIFERKNKIDSKFRFDLMTKYFDDLFLANFFYSKLKGNLTNG
jgi:predicted nucleotidyltransferase